MDSPRWLCFVFIVFNRDLVLLISKGKNRKKKIKGSRHGVHIFVSKTMFFSQNKRQTNQQKHPHVKNEIKKKKKKQQQQHIYICRGQYCQKIINK